MVTKDCLRISWTTYEIPSFLLMLTLLTSLSQFLHLQKFDIPVDVLIVQVV